MAAISVGSVSVDVVPSVRGFARQLRRELVPQATEIGREIGDGLAAGVRAGLGDPIGDPMEESARRQRRQAPKQGDQVAGAFAKAFQRRLKAAFEALPKAEIDADATEAQREIAALRARLEALSEKTIGVDIDAGDALAEMEEIRTGLEALNERDVSIDVRADAGAALTQLAAVRAESDRLSRSTDEGGAAQERFRGQVQQTTRGLTANRATLVSLIGVGVAAGAGITSAGAAFAAFGVVSAGSIVKVIAAQADLTGTWDTLTKRQKIAATSVQSLIVDYKALSKAYEPEALAVFNSLIGTARGLMPQLGAVVDATSADMQRFVTRITEFTSARVGGEFLTWAGRAAPEALDVFGTTMVVAGDTALDLIQDMAPLGIEVLQLTNGVLKGINAIAGINPLLAQFAISAVALRQPVAGVVTGVTNMTARFRTASTAAQGAAKAGKLLNLVTAAGPNLYVAAGVALAFLAVKALTAKTGTDRLVDSLRVSYQAVGNNLVGHQQLAAALARRINIEKELAAVAVKANTAGAEGAGLTGRHAQAVEKLTAARNAELRAQSNIIVGSAQLAQQYNITSGQATRLADAAGVDLSSSMDKSGRLTAAARQKIDQYAQSAALAANPTRAVSIALADAGNKALTMETRMKALKAALDAYFSPSIAVFQATTQLKQGYRDISDALTKVRDAHIRDSQAMTGNTAASRALRQAFASQLVTVRDLYTATFQQTGSTDKASAAVRTQLPILYSLAGRNKEARAQVDALARSTGNSTAKQNIAKGAFVDVARQMGVTRERAEQLWKEYNKLPGSTSNAARGVESFSVRTLQALKEIKPKNVPVTVTAQGTFKHATTAGLASGGPVPAGLALGSGGPTADDVPIMASVGEHMLTAKEVSAVGGHGAVYRLRAAMLRGDLQGFAAGGAVSLTYRGSSPSQIHKAAYSTPDLHRQIEREHQAAREQARELALAWKKYAASGGNALAWARSQAGKPYIWGGVGPRGYDCSGWWSALVNVVRGRSPHSRLFTTHNFTGATGPAGFVRNRRSPVMVGVTHAGVGHMGGTIGVTNTESSGSAGVRVGGGARGWAHPLFTTHYGLRMATGGAVERDLATKALRRSASRHDVALAATLGLVGDPSSLVSPVHPKLLGFDDGGLLQPGPSLVYNGTGRPEPVLSGRQFDALYAAAGSGGGGARKISVMEGATVIVSDPVDVDMLAQRQEFAARSATFG